MIKRAYKWHDCGWSNDPIFIWARELALNRATYTLNGILNGYTWDIKVNLVQHATSHLETLVHDPFYDLGISEGH